MADNPEIRIETHSTWCSLGPRPLVATGYLVQWFQAHFSREASIEHPELRGILWTPELASKVLIESVTRWKPSVTEQRPAILVGCNEWSTFRGGINDEPMGTAQTPNSARYFGCFIQGSHTLFCISSQPAEAVILGSEVYREMMQFGPLVREELDLKRFVTVGCGKLSRLKEARENYVVPVTVAYIAEEQWKIIPHTPFIKRIHITALIEP